jgi:hypothetical protein
MTAAQRKAALKLNKKRQAPMAIAGGVHEEDEDEDEAEDEEAHAMEDDEAETPAAPLDATQLAALIEPVCFWVITIYLVRLRSEQSAFVRSNPPSFGATRLRSEPPHLTQLATLIEPVCFGSSQSRVSLRSEQPAFVRSNQPSFGATRLRSEAPLAYKVTTFVQSRRICLSRLGC